MLSAQNSYTLLIFSLHPAKANMQRKTPRAPRASFAVSLPHDNFSNILIDFVLQLLKTEIAERVVQRVELFKLLILKAVLLS